MTIEYKSIIFISFGLIFFALGCRKSQNFSLEIIEIPNRTDEPILLSEMVNFVHEIQLETSQGNYLGSLKDVKLYKERLYIVELYKISIFDLEGNFIQQLGMQGEGPGEYRSVTSMAIHEDSGLIYVSAYNKLLVYDTDFKLLEERKLGFPIGYLKILDGDLWIVSEEIGVEIGEEIGNQTNIYILNDTFDVTDTIPFRTVVLDQIRFGGYGLRYWLSDVEEGLFLYIPVLTPENIIRDTLYQLIENKVTPSLKFQFERPQSLDSQGMQTLALLNIFNSTSFYILEYDQDYKRFMFLYDKKNQKGYNLKEGLLDEYEDPMFLRPLDLKQDLFYYIKKVEFEDKSIEELNPLIGIVKLK